MIKLSGLAADKLLDASQIECASQARLERVDAVAKSSGYRAQLQWDAATTRQAGCENRSRVEWDAAEAVALAEFAEVEKQIPPV